MSQLKDKDYQEEHENIRKTLCIQAWVGTANSDTCIKPDTATLYADKALREFDKRFNKPKI